MLIAMIRATHPEPTGAVILVAGLLALAVGHPPGTAALVATTVAASQLAVGWTNDAVDADRDTTVRRADKPVAAGAVSRRTVAIAAGCAAAATVVLALRFDRTAATVAIAGLASGLAYDWPLKLTAFSVLPYALSFAALPAFVVLAGPATPPGWLLVAGGLLGAGAHFANVLPDLADDAATGVRGLPHRLGPKASGVAAGGLLLATTAVLVWGPPGRASWPGLAAAGFVAVALPASWAAARTAGAAGRRPTIWFRAVLLVAVIDVLLLVAGGGLV